MSTPTLLPASSVHSTVLAVIAHPDGGQVLTSAGELPRLDLPRNVYFGSGVAADFSALLGAELELLRRLDSEKLNEVALHDSGLSLRRVVWTLGLMGEIDANLEWTAPAELPPEQRAWAESALSPVPAARPLWHRPGGQRRLLAWLDAELAAQERPRTTDIEVIKHSQISFLARVQTAEGALYLKAVPEFFARELPITAWLSRELPGGAPFVLACDRSLGALLLGDAGERTEVEATGWNGPAEHPERWTLDDSRALLRHLARVQRATETRLPELMDLNLSDHGPEYLLERLPILFEPERLLEGQPGGLSAADIERFKALRPALEAALTRLAASRVPRTLGHGDLHEGNVVVRDGKFTLIDWSDASITHPFLDANPRYLVPEAHAEAAAEAYLEAWAGLLPLSELRALLRDAEWAGEVYRALGLILGIQPHVEDDSEQGDAHLYHVQALLRMTI
jgi:Phosphotransferase enzyme family